MKRYFLLLVGNYVAGADYASGTPLEDQGFPFSKLVPIEVDEGPLADNAGSVVAGSRIVQHQVSFTQRYSDIVYQMRTVLLSDKLQIIQTFPHTVHIPSGKARTPVLQAA